MKLTDEIDLQKPSRKILIRSIYRKIGGTNILGISMKNLFWESSNDDMGITAPAFCSDVVNIQSQAIKLSYQDEDCETRSAFPDLLDDRSEKLAIECKFWKFLIKNKHLYRFDKIKDAALFDGYIYILIVDLQIRSNPHRKITDYIKRYLSRNESLIHSNKIISYLQKSAHFLLKEIALTTDHSLTRLFNNSKTNPLDTRANVLIE